MGSDGAIIRRHWEGGWSYDWWGEGTDPNPGPKPLTDTCGHTHRDHRNSRAGPQGFGSSPASTQGGCPLFRAGPLRVLQLGPSLLQSPSPSSCPHLPRRVQSVAAASGQPLIPQEHLGPHVRGQTLLVCLGLCPAPQGAWPFSPRAWSGGTQLSGRTKIRGPLGRSPRVREVGTPPPGLLRLPSPALKQP